MLGRCRLDHAEPGDPDERDESNEGKAGGEQQHPQLRGQELAMADVDEANARGGETGIERECVHS